MANQKVDPGAFLIAVLTVAVVPLTEDGRWDLMNSGIACVVGFLVCCYLVPDQHSTRGHWLAFTVVLGVIVAVGLAYFVQQCLWPAGPPPDFSDLESVTDAAARDDMQADKASGLALVIGISISAAVTSVLRLWQKRITKVKAELPIHWMWPPDA